MMETQYKLLHIFCYPQWKALVHEIAAIQAEPDKLQWGKEKKKKHKIKKVLALKSEAKSWMLQKLWLEFPKPLLCPKDMGGVHRHGDNWKVT